MTQFHWKFCRLTPLWVFLECYNESTRSILMLLLCQLFKAAKISEILQNSIIKMNLIRVEINQLSTEVSRLRNMDGFNSVSGHVLPAQTVTVTQH